MRTVVERGETVDVFALFNTVCDDIDRLRTEGGEPGRSPHP
jgi:hypothetical protein